MMDPRNLLKILLLTAIISLIDHAGASPVTRLPDLKDDLTKQSSDEVSDLNVSAKISNDNRAAHSSKSSSEEVSSFAHRDEDEIAATIASLLNDRYKYDVEILESRDMQKESEEVEERFKGGAAIRMDTDHFDDEDIEVDLIAENDSDQSNHTIFAILLVVVTLVSIGLYAAMVMWRMHLEERYGTRELLHTEDDDDDFVRIQNNNNNNNNNEIGNSHDQH